MKIEVGQVWQMRVLVEGVAVGAQPLYLVLSVGPMYGGIPSAIILGLDDGRVGWQPVDTIDGTRASYTTWTLLADNPRRAA